MSSVGGQAPVRPDRVSARTPTWRGAKKERRRKARVGKSRAQHRGRSSNPPRRRGVPPDPPPGQGCSSRTRGLAVRAGRRRVPPDGAPLLHMGGRGGIGRRRRLAAAATPVDSHPPAGHAPWRAPASPSPASSDRWSPGRGATIATVCFSPLARGGEGEDVVAVGQQRYWWLHQLHQRGGRFSHLPRSRREHWLGGGVGAAQGAAKGGVGAAQAAAGTKTPRTSTLTASRPSRRPRRCAARCRRSGGWAVVVCRGA